MADVEITLGFTTAEALELAPMILQRAQDMAQNPIVIQLLAVRDIESVDELTVRQQAKLLLYVTLMDWLQQYKRREAEINHGETAAQLVAETFPVEVD